MILFNRNNRDAGEEQEGGGRKKRFSWFNLAKDGKGVKKEDVITKYTLINFFKLYGRRFGTIACINALYVFGNFPVFFYFLANSGNVSQPSLSHNHLLYHVFRGVLLGGIDPVTAALNGVIGVPSTNYVPTTLTYVILSLSLLVLLTFGVVNVGTAYLLRNIVKCEPIFFLNDFFYAIRRNWKQALPFGVLDIGIVALLIYDIVFFYYNLGSSFMDIMFFVSLVLLVVYFCMRFYIYLLMLTFNLSIFKIIKNAFIFSIIGIKRNIVALFGIVMFTMTFYGLLISLFPIGVLIPFTIFFGTCAFMATYAAWPKIKEIMIDPYQTEPEEPENLEEPIFKDRG